MNQNKQEHNNKIKVEYENLIYLINKEEKTSEIIGFYSEIRNILIPRSINYQSQEYIVTAICGDAFENSDEMQSIQFAPDSGLRTIKNNAFACSSFESIEIPSSVIELEEEWCNELMNVTKISVHPNNQRYSSIDDNYIIGKSSKDKENFDVFVFSVRNVETVTIPSFIEIIGPYAFAECGQIKSIEFSTDSKLRLIQKCAFFDSSIKSISIPSSVTEFCEESFNSTNFEHIEIPDDSKLQVIRKNAFYSSLITSITIPSSLIKLEDGWCNDVKKVEKINVSSNNQYYSSIDDQYIIGRSSNEKENFDVLVFSVRNIEKATVPDFIEIIGPQSFANCTNLRRVEFSKDSKLRVIGKNSFSYTEIESITIPSHVTHICKQAFSGCERLRAIEFPIDSELQKIDEYSFMNTVIESIVIPSSVTELKENWCALTNKLVNVKVMQENKFYCSSVDDKIIFGKSSENFDHLVFAARDIQHLKIPDSIEIIESHAFAVCESIQRVEFSLNSKLLSINDFAFYNSSIQRIKIPKNVTRIGISAFSSCMKLKQIEFSPDSNLQIIDHFAFSFSAIESIVIPSNITKIHDSSFYSCNNLKLIEFDTDIISPTEFLSVFSSLDNANIMIPKKYQGI
ncbi:hypothetical protein M9Y10_000512 [Tritrichomonas musculus]|uniref:Surface antigen BspA-like n=1 Tax=Tritrichomonas musculus TaxID=1915356 RepID=A0ABR2L4H4_9EUKA